MARDFDLSPSSLDPLEPFRDYLTIISNTDVRTAEAVQRPEIGGDHFRSSATYLTQAHPKQTEGSDVHAGNSHGPDLRQDRGQDTPIPSMQLCIENVDQAGRVRLRIRVRLHGHDQLGVAHEPLPMIRDPRVAFDQLFGAGGTPDGARERRRTERSILDWIAGEVARLKRELGPTDRRAHGPVPRRTSARSSAASSASRRTTRAASPRAPGAPAGVPDEFDEHVKLMFDLQAVAFAADMTRVFSFKMGRDGSGRVYPGSGVNAGFHRASHHGEQREARPRLRQDQQYHVSMVPYFLEG